MSPRMSPKTLIIAAAALAASSAVILPALSATPDGQNPTGQQGQARPVPLRATILFNLVDRNGDGAIDQDETSALQKAIFSAIDADKDGKLSPDEFKKIAAGFEGGGPGGQRGPGHFGRGPDGRGPGFRHGPGDNRQGQIEQGQRPGPQDQMMPQLGDNQDGQPPQGAGQPRDFASLDTNGDGVVSADEFAAGAPAGLPGMLPPQ